MLSAAARGRVTPHDVDRVLDDAVRARRISRLHRPNYATVLRDFLLPNRPVTITGVVDAWPAYKRYATAEGAVDLDRLCDDAGGDSAVPVDTLPLHSSAGAYGTCERNHMPLRDFADLWRRAAAAEDGAAPAASALYYLRDWHFARDCPQAAACAYAAPDCFGEDWLNDWWLGPRDDEPADDAATATGHDDAGAARPRSPPPPADDFRFLYLGQRGSWTALHHDVLCSHSWSASLCGRKRWLLFPPRTSQGH